MEIPYGYCHCGCGRKTNIAKCSSKKNGVLAGQPYRFYGRHGCARIRPRIVQPEDPDIRHIALTQGKIAIVDRQDYEWLMRWNWCAFRSRNGGHFYAARSGLVDGRFMLIYMHREVMGVNPLDLRTVDHREIFNTLDNRRSNLRIASCSQQMINRRLQSNNTSGYKGVSFHKPTGKWRAIINVDRRAISLGYFHSREAAYKAYCEAAAKYHGDFARVA